jgi:hypothetical protein
MLHRRGRRTLRASSGGTVVLGRRRGGCWSLVCGRGRRRGRHRGFLALQRARDGLEARVAGLGHGDVIASNCSARGMLGSALGR